MGEFLIYLMRDHPFGYVRLKYSCLHFAIFNAQACFANHKSTQEGNRNSHEQGLG